MLTQEADGWRYCRRMKEHTHHFKSVPRIKNSTKYHQRATQNIWLRWRFCVCAPCLCHRFEMIDAARNKVRVKACYVMMATTIGACLLMVFLGKRVSDSGKDFACFVFLQYLFTRREIVAEWFTTTWKSWMSLLFLMYVRANINIMWNIGHFSDLTRNLSHFVAGCRQARVPDRPKHGEES